MKSRMGFVTNSSTTNFMLVNITKEPLTLKDFFLENMELVHSYMEDVIADGYDDGSEGEVSEDLDAWLTDETIKPYSILHYDLSESYDITEQVLKGMEPAEGKSDRFIWMRKRE